MPRSRSGRPPAVEDGVVDVGQRVQVDESRTDDRIAVITRHVGVPSVPVADEDDAVVRIHDLAMVEDDVVAVREPDHNLARDLAPMLPPHVSIAHPSARRHRP